MASTVVVTTGMPAARWQPGFTGWQRKCLVGLHTMLTDVTGLDVIGLDINAALTCQRAHSAKDAGAI